jgi:glycosyltransferase involved in cell wall biosynthesis
MNVRNSPKIIYLTAGAAGMYCGSCMHDNALAKALAQVGWDVQLVPTYTPIRTDETNVSVDQVFFGGINVYLQQKIPLMRFLPSALDRFLDNPRLIRRATAKASETSPRLLGQLAQSMLLGLRGNQRKEVKRLCRWLAAEKPDLILFTNILIGGCIPEIKRQLNVPVLVTLQGDDVFLDSLPQPYQARCIEQIRQIASQVDGFIVHSDFFRNYMSNYFGLEKSRIHVTPLGIDTHDFRHFTNQARQPVRRDVRTIGYLAKLAPQKGLHCLVDAFIHLKSQPGTENVKLEIAGWLGPENTAYAKAEFERLRSAGLTDDFEYIGSVDRQQKMALLERLDVLSVPTEYLEPKGIYVLEAMAAGVPVVQPDHACFPELIAQSDGGLLFKAGDPVDHATVLHRVLTDHATRSELSRNALQFVHGERNAQEMANVTSRLLSGFLK